MEPPGNMGNMHPCPGTGQEVEAQATCYQGIFCVKKKGVKISLNGNVVYFQPLAVPRSDDWGAFVRTLQDLKTEQADQEEEQQQASISSSPMR